MRQKGVVMDTATVQAVEFWPTPQNVYDLQCSFTTSAPSLHLSCHSQGRIKENCFTIFPEPCFTYAIIRDIDCQISQTPQDHPAEIFFLPIFMMPKPTSRLPPYLQVTQVSQRLTNYFPTNTDGNPCYRTLIVSSSHL